MIVRDIMSKKVESIAPDASLKRAASKMRDLNIGSLAVMEDGKLLGIVTDRDISCHAVAIGYDSETHVDRVMVKDVTVCYEDQDIADAADLMRDHKVRRLAVLHHDNSLAGILSVDDLACGSHELAGEVLESASPSH